MVVTAAPRVWLYGRNMSQPSVQEGPGFRRRIWKLGPGRSGCHAWQLCVRTAAHGGVGSRLSWDAVIQLWLPGADAVHDPVRRLCSKTNGVFAGPCFRASDHPNPVLAAIWFRWTTSASPSAWTPASFIDSGHLFCLPVSTSIARTLGDEAADSRLSASIAATRRRSAGDVQRCIRS